MNQIAPERDAFAGSAICNAEGPRTSGVRRVVGPFARYTPKSNRAAQTMSQNHPSHCSADAADLGQGGALLSSHAPCSARHFRLHSRKQITLPGSSCFRGFVFFVPFTTRSATAPSGSKSPCFSKSSVSLPHVQQSTGNVENVRKGLGEIRNVEC